MDKTTLEVCRQDLSDLFDSADHLPRKIKPARSVRGPPRHAGRDTEISVLRAPRKQASINGHSEGRSYQREPVDNRTHLSCGGSSDRGDNTNRQPRLTMLLEVGLDLIRTEVDQMLEPSSSHGAMEFCRKRVKPPTDLFDLVDREGLERALRLDFSRDVD
jgi:hypothetical protein